MGKDESEHKTIRDVTLRYVEGESRYRSLQKYDKFREDIRKLGTFASDNTIEATAHAYRINIVIHVGIISNILCENNIC
jgi:hypothetical protein